MVGTLGLSQSLIGFAAAGVVLLAALCLRDVFLVQVGMLPATAWILAAAEDMERLFETTILLRS
jgi:hypothetical protein